MRRDGEMKPLIWGESKAEYFFMQDWTGFRARRFFARRANHRGVAFNHSAACKASSIAYRCYATTQYAEPVIGRAFARPVGYCALKLGPCRENSLSPRGGFDELSERTALNPCRPTIHGGRGGPSAACEVACA